MVPLPRPNAEPSAAVLKEASEAIERLLATRNVRLKFSVEGSSGVAPDRVVIELVDEQSGSVIKRIPPDKLMHIVSGIEELAGLLVDAQAR